MWRTLCCSSRRISVGNVWYPYYHHQCSKFLIFDHEMRSNSGSHNMSWVVLQNFICMCVVCRPAYYYCILWIRTLICTNFSFNNRCSKESIHIHPNFEWYSPRNVWFVEHLVESVPLLPPLWCSECVFKNTFNPLVAFLADLSDL